MDAQELISLKKDLHLPDIRYYLMIGSTNDTAMHWSREGAEDGCMVIADTQTEGRGRHSRKWQTVPGTALAFSLIFRPRQREKANIALFSPLAGVAVCDALIRGWNLTAKIKWPNDILIHRKKVCGILVETAWDGEEPVAVIVGIGMNIAHNSIPPADEMQFPVTCIDDEHGQPIPRYEILKMVVNTCFEWRKDLAKPEFFQYWQEHLAFQGEPVRIIEDGKTIVYGKQAGILPDGRLEIITENNVKIGITAGDLHLRPGK